MRAQERPLSSGTGQRPQLKQHSKNNTSKNGCQGVNIQDAAIELLNLGFSVIPTNADKTPMLPSWKPYQEKLMTKDTVKLTFRDGCSLALVGGVVSGNLECLDFDKPDFFQLFLETLGQQNPQLAAKLPKRGTPSGGYHLPYR